MIKVWVNGKERYIMDKKDMPNPTNEDLEDPKFNVIWDVIKSWDVEVPEYYSGYCGSNGSHVMLILEALRKLDTS